MPRPIKRRMVCELPRYDSFGPVYHQNELANTEIIILSVEEFETIRSIDLEGLDQEECAARMDVARSTVQRIYNEARLKIAESLVYGKTMKISGGNYSLCTKESEVKSDCCRQCRRHQHGRHRHL